MRPLIAPLRPTFLLSVGLRLRRLLGGSFRLHLRPELLFGKPFTVAKLLAGALHDGTELRRIRHQETLDLLLILHTEDDRDRSALAGHHHGPALGGFQEGAELGFDLRDRSDLHSRTSSPPMK